MNNEALGPAERLIQTVLAHSDHMVHNRPGIVTNAPGSATGVNWSPVTHKDEPINAADAAGPKAKVVYGLTKVGKQTHRTRIGVLGEDGAVKVANGAIYGRYQPAGIFPEVAGWMYKQVADVWKLDNEFAARWASYAFGQEHKDLKVVLAAFMLCQSRRGDPIRDTPGAGPVLFHDVDYRDVGEAMTLLLRKDGRDLNPKLLLRVHGLLTVPAVQEVNRQLGFAKGRGAFLGRWPKAVTKWLEFREENPKLLEGLVKAGFRTTVMELARRVGYKPTSPAFFETLRWKQAQAKDGRRTLAIGRAVAAAESWADLDERGICEAIQRTKPNWKRIVGLIPKKIGVTRAIVAVAIETGGLSDKDLIILTPTLEELGLLQVQDVKARWEAAIRRADDMRAANIAKNVKSQETKDKLEEAADTALKTAVAEVMKALRVYVFVDTSGSMDRSIEAAKRHLAKFVQGFPMDQLHVARFNTKGTEIAIPHPSARGVEQAFVGVAATGGTDYGSGVKALLHRRPKDDEDVLFIFVGDEEAGTFAKDVRQTGFNPMAFGFVKVGGGPQYNAVRGTAAELKIPCFMIDEKTFEDPYAIPRTIRALVAATPVNQAAAYTDRIVPRVTLVDVIMKTEILAKPVWAA